MSATARSRLAAPAKPPSERGNSSYQVEKRPRWRSTHSASGAAVTSSGRGTPATAAPTASSRPAFSRTSVAHEARRSAAAASVTRLRRTAGTSAARRSSRRAPSSSSVSTSWPAPALAATSRRQVAKRSGQASTTRSDRPTRARVTVASQRSLPTWSRGTASSSRTERTRAASTSWPSLKMSADTWNGSPTAALAGSTREGVRGRTSVIVRRGSTLPPFQTRTPDETLRGSTVPGMRSAR
jgi:hypothetical protein